MTNAPETDRWARVPVWPLVILILLTLAPVAVILYDTIQDMPARMPLMRAISHPDVGGTAKVYAFMIGMLLWLVTVPLTAIYAIVLTVSRTDALIRRRRARNRDENI